MGTFLDKNRFTEDLQIFENIKVKMNESNINDYAGMLTGQSYLFQEMNRTELKRNIFLQNYERDLFQSINKFLHFGIVFFISK